MTCYTQHAKTLYYNTFQCFLTNFQEIICINDWSGHQKTKKKVKKKSKDECLLLRESFCTWGNEEETAISEMPPKETFPNPNVNCATMYGLLLSYTIRTLSLGFHSFLKLQFFFQHTPGFEWLSVFFSDAVAALTPPDVFEFSLFCIHICKTEIFRMRVSLLWAHSWETDNEEQKRRSENSGASFPLI